MPKSKNTEPSSHFQLNMFQENYNKLQILYVHKRFAPLYGQYIALLIHV